MTECKIGGYLTGEAKEQASGGAHSSDSSLSITKTVTSGLIVTVK